MSLGGWGIPRMSHSERKPETGDPKHLPLHCFTASGLVLGQWADCGCSGPLVTTDGGG